VIKRIKRILKKITSASSNNQEEEQRIDDLISNKDSDTSRWKKNEQLFVDWNERTGILGSYTKDNASIIEFGAGNMYLKNILKSGQKYTPSDIVKRFPDTVTCDLNKPITFSLEKYDTAIFSGVLEYVYDVDAVFQQLKESDVEHVILSYCCNDIIKLSRTKNGWLSDFSKADMEAIFRKNNYEILDYQEWRDQSIFNLRQQ